MTQPWQGTFTAIVTPFQPDGSLDESSLRTLVERQIEGGVDGLVPCGTTGESATMSTEEKLRVIEIVREQGDGRTRVLAGGDLYDRYGQRCGREGGFLDQRGERG